MSSVITGNAVNCEGSRVPGFSLPAIAFLSSLSFSGARVFEFGSGDSTFYWSRRLATGELRSYHAVERDSEVYRRLRGRHPCYRESVLNVSSDEMYLRTAYAVATSFTLKDEAFIPFDLTILNGPLSLRSREMEEAARVTCSEGVIICNESEQIAESVEKLCDRLAFCRIDFTGLTPSADRISVTSLLFRNSCWLFGAKLSLPDGGKLHLSA